VERLLSIVNALMSDQIGGAPVRLSTVITMIRPITCQQPLTASSSTPAHLYVSSDRSL